jgi:hypothetical protein
MTHKRGLFTSIRRRLLNGMQVRRGPSAPASANDT